MVINKHRLTLQGQDKSNTIIDGGNGNKPIIIVNADNVTIRNFTIRNAGIEYDSFGVHLNYSKNAYLSDNIFSGNRYSIRAMYSFNITVKSSTFSGDTGGAAILAGDSQTGLVEKCTMNGSTVGVFLINSTNVTVRSNMFYSSVLAGITVATSQPVWIVANTFTFDNTSISIKYKGGNTVVGNTISNSRTAGLQLQSSTGNVIHHNNFINNTEQVKFVSTPTVNSWNTSGDLSEGNYWSDYTGTDTDKNGIGDQWYNIATGNIDARPLIGPFQEFTVGSQTGPRKVYTVSNSVISGFSFNQAAKQINFQVSGANGTLGICRVVFPTDLIESPYTVFVNWQSQVHGAVYNFTHVAIYFSYTHGTQASNIIVVPEFPIVLLLPFFALLTLLIAVLKRKKKI
ncbi:MAG: NosD domain-containing protein [Candidatus Bathyarchaeia archaeon]